MKKAVKIMCITVVLLCFSMNFAYATEISDLETSIVPESLIDDIISGKSQDILGEIDIDISANIAESGLTIAENAKKYVNEAIYSVMSTMVQVFVILIISSLALGFANSNEFKSINNYINMATAISIATVILSDIRGVFAISMDAIFEIETLANGIVPTMVTAMSVAGVPTTAVLSQTASMFVLSLIIMLISDILFPFLYIYIAVITVNASIGNDILTKLAEFIKWITTTSLKLILTGFITYLSVASVISGTADSFVLKSAKFATGLIPYVGSIISDASETIVIGASVIKNAVGIFGIFAIIAICIIPLTQIITNFFAFKVMSVVISPINTKQIANLLSGISDGYSMALAMVFSSGAILFIMLVISIMMANG